MHTIRAHVLEPHAAGLSPAAIARQLNVAPTTVAYHLRGADEPAQARRSTQAARSAAEGLVSDVIVVSTRERVRELFVDGTYRGRFNLKTRLIRDGLRPDRCEVWGLREWQGAPITLALHHINGRRHDNRLENLQLLCPNCHSQTKNFAGRNPLLSA